MDDRINKFVVTAFTFEAALGAIALGVGTYVGIDPLETIPISTADLKSHLLAILLGLGATAPLLLGLFIVIRLNLAPFVRLREFVLQKLLPLFAPLSVFELAAICIAAGFGEEVLFRGLIQAGLAGYVGGTNGVVIGLIVASLLFGMCHWITPTYAMLAALAGLYFGAIFLWSDNLLTPLTAHALYDFIALLYLTRGPKAGEPA